MTRTKIVFIGPMHTKAEIKQEHGDYIDYVMTFEELQAVIDSRDIIAGFAGNCAG